MFYQFYNIKFLLYEKKNPFLVGSYLDFSDKALAYSELLKTSKERFDHCTLLVLKNLINPKWLSVDCKKKNCSQCSL